MYRIRSSCLQATFCRLKETVTLPQVPFLVKRVCGSFSKLFSASHPALVSKGEGIRCVIQDAVAFTFEASGVAEFSADETAALSHENLEREAARQTRSL